MQIESELAGWVSTALGLSSPKDFSLAVVGLKLSSEHDDDCCVTIELATDTSSSSSASSAQGGEGGGESGEEGESAKAKAEAQRARVRSAWEAGVGKGVSKGSKPDWLRFGLIPRNFKGTVLTKDLAAAWKAASGKDDPL